MIQSSAAWLRARIEACTSTFVVYSQILPLAESMAENCRRELARAENHAVANIYHVMLVDLEEVISDYATAA